MTSESTSNPTATRTVTVEVPEDRVEQFHAFVQRFLSSEGPWRGRQGPRGRRPGPRRARHLRRAMYHLAMAQHSGEHRSHRCGRPHGHESESAETTAGPTDIATV